MKIGILTFHNADNYGSVLQAYALKKYVGGLDGVEKCKIVNYIPPNQEELYAIYLDNRSVKNIVKNLRAFCFRKLLKNRKKTFVKAAATPIDRKSEAVQKFFAYFLPGK